MLQSLMIVRIEVYKTLLIVQLTLLIEIYKTLWNYYLAIITKTSEETLDNVQNVRSLPIIGVLNKSRESLQTHL